MTTNDDVPGGQGGGPANAGIRRITVSGEAFSVTRMSSDRFDLPPGQVLPSSDSYSVIVQLADFADHRLHRNARLVHAGGHAAGALAITDMQDAWRCDHRSPFDNVRFSLTRAALSEFVEEEGGRRFDGLANPAGSHDQVALQIALAMTPALDDPKGASRLFVDQIHYALVAHLLHAYGATQERRHRGGLSACQKTRAMDFMAAQSGRDVSVAEVAAECRLSRGYFIKAFKSAVGRTPHRWLTEHRVSEAKTLLMTDISIAEIATACGFADQSHLTRVFTQIVGLTPAAWRRQCGH